LLPTDPGLSDAVARIFKIIGDGVPSRVEKAPYNISKDVYLSLVNGKIRNQPVSDANVYDH
jgi:hypothetical protein